MTQPYWMIPLLNSFKAFCFLCVRFSFSRLPPLSRNYVFRVYFQVNLRQDTSWAVTFILLTLVIGCLYDTMDTHKFKVLLSFATLLLFLSYF